LVLIHPHLMKTSTFLDYRGLSHDFPYIFPWKTLYFQIF
jgi:hypothetical protein